MVWLSGRTAMLSPLPAAVPPQDVVYHCQLAPVPSEPPITFSETSVPGQTVSKGVIRMLVAAMLFDPTRKRAAFESTESPVQIQVRTV